MQIGNAGADAFHLGDGYVVRPASAGVVDHGDRGLRVLHDLGSRARTNMHLQVTHVRAAHTVPICELDALPEGDEVVVIGDWPIGDVVVMGAWLIGDVVIDVPAIVVAVPIMLVDESLAPLPAIVFIWPRSITSPVLGCCAATFAGV